MPHVIEIKTFKITDDDLLFSSERKEIKIKKSNIIHVLSGEFLYPFELSKFLGGSLIALALFAAFLYYFFL